jgi:hypothetical protein
MEYLAHEVATLDRASKTAENRLKEAKVVLVAAMDAEGTTSVTLPSGRTTISIVDGERLDVDYEALSETDPKIASKVRVSKVDLALWRAGITAGIINVDLAASVSKAIPYRQVRVNRK